VGCVLKKRPERVLTCLQKKGLKPKPARTLKRPFDLSEFADHALKPGGDARLTAELRRV
jgi:hypothetical protein